MILALVTKGRSTELETSTELKTIIESIAGDKGTIERAAVQTMDEGDVESKSSQVDTLKGQVATEINKWPPNDGFHAEARLITLQENDVIDRYGSPRGRFASPFGVSFNARSLELSEEEYEYHVYRVLEPIDDVLSGPAEPWFNKEGLGMQYKLSNKIEWYLARNWIEEINNNKDL